MGEVTLILPNDMSILQDKYAEVLAEIVGERLTTEELGYLIQQIEKKN